MSQRLLDEERCVDTGRTSEETFDVLVGNLRFQGGVLDRKSVV